ncbi:hypothetical protein V1525DRAFT_396136 [Lipomyces kononenkoae]|uniref:Uncharacterized protein n=1 Tax=Lipomyces kononenkoae TaxID=34357 RepID=A0ACC3T875_LIPKO
MRLDKRQWWYAGSSAWGVKWGIFGGIILGTLLLCALAYIHARHRIAKGLQPLRYHSWLVQHRVDVMQRQRHAYAGDQTYREQHYPAYPMNTFYSNNTDMAPPPPAYDPRYPAPPQYIPPPDTKAHETAPPPPASELEDAASSSSSPPAAQHTEDPYRSAARPQNPAPAADPASAGTAYRYA